MKPKQKIVRKSIGLSESMWREIANYRFRHRVGTETDAVRRLLQASLVLVKGAK